MQLHKLTWILAIAGIILTMLLYAFSDAFAMWGEALIVLSGFMAVILLVDKYFLKALDIIEELKNGNNAVANFFGLLLIAFAIVILGFATK